MSVCGGVVVRWWLASGLGLMKHILLSLDRRSHYPSLYALFVFPETTEKI